MSIYLNLFSLFRPKPSPHKETRYYAATGAERKLARRRYLDRQLELAVAVSRLSDEQAKQARERASVRAQGQGRGAA